MLAHYKNLRCRIIAPFLGAGNAAFMPQRVVSEEIYLTPSRVLTTVQRLTKIVASLISPIVMPVENDQKDCPQQEIKTLIEGK